MLENNGEIPCNLYHFSFHDGYIFKIILQQHNQDTESIIVKVHSDCFLSTLEPLLPSSGSSPLSFSFFPSFWPLAMTVPSNLLQNIRKWSHIFWTASLNRVSFPCCCVSVVLFLFIIV